MAQGIVVRYWTFLH